MDKRNKIITIFCIIINSIIIIINIIITYFIANGRWVNRMPGPNVNYSLMKDFYDLFLGRGFPTIFISLLTVIVVFIINKLVLKQDNKVKTYVILFCILCILNMIVYRIGMRIAV